MPVTARQLDLLLAAAVVVGPLAMQIYLPVLPAVADDFGVGNDIVQLTFSIYIAALALSQLVVGTLSDRFGRRPLLVAGAGLFVLGSIACALAPTIEALIAGRAIQAAGGGAGLVLARAVLSDLYTPSQMAKRLSTIIMLMVIGPTLGPIVGAYVARIAGWRGIFWVVAVAGVLVFIALLTRMPETLRAASPGDDRRFASGIRRSLAEPRFLGYALITCATMAIYYAFISIVPVLMGTLFAQPPEAYGWYSLTLAVAYFAGNFVATRKAEAFGIRRTTLSGNSLALAGLAILAGIAIAGYWHPLWLFLPMMLVVFANGFSSPSTQAGAVAQVPQRAGTASSLVSFAMQLTGAGVAQLLALAPLATPLPLALTMVALGIVALALSGLMAGTGDPTRP